MEQISHIIRVSIWPLVIITLAYMFRSDLRGFMNRLFRIKFPGGESKLKKIKELQYSVNIMIPTLEVDYSDKEHHNLLQELEFERLYNVLLPMQLDFLGTLGGNKLAVPFYMDVFETYQDDNQPVLDSWSSDDFLYLLAKSDLVTIGEEAVSLSDFGILFLQYLFKRNYPLEKWI